MANPRLEQLVALVAPRLRAQLDAVERWLPGAGEPPVVEEALALAPPVTVVMPARGPAAAALLHEASRGEERLATAAPSAGDAPSRVDAEVSSRDPFSTAETPAVQADATVVQKQKQSPARPPTPWTRVTLPRPMRPPALRRLPGISTVPGKASPAALPPAVPPKPPSSPALDHPPPPGASWAASPISTPRTSSTHRLSGISPPGPLDHAPSRAHEDFDLGERLADLIEASALEAGVDLT